MLTDVRSDPIAQLAGHRPPRDWEAEALTAIAAIRTDDEWLAFTIDARFRLAWLDHTGLNPKGPEIAARIRAALHGRARALDAANAERARAASEPEDPTPPPPSAWPAGRKQKDLFKGTDDGR